MRSRAAVLQLLAGIVLLCSATRAQVSILLLLKSRRRRNRSSQCLVAQSLDVSSSGSGGRGRRYRSLFLLAVMRRVPFTMTAEVLRGQRACGGVRRARWILCDDRNIETPSIASFVLFSPRPHRQLAASSVIYFEWAMPSVSSSDQEIFQRTWDRERKLFERCSSAVAGSTETLRKEKEKIKTALSFAFLFFPLSRSLRFLALRYERRRTEE